MFPVYADQTLMTTLTTTMNLSPLAFALCFGPAWPMDIVVHALFGRRKPEKRRIISTKCLKLRIRQRDNGKRREDYKPE